METFNVGGRKTHILGFPHIRGPVLDPSNKAYSTFEVTLGLPIYGSWDNCKVLFMVDILAG